MLLGVYKLVEVGDQLVKVHRVVALKRQSLIVHRGIYVDVHKGGQVLVVRDH